MDRLVCGDVGYGKTEVALRAAFLTVENGQQVALSCPRQFWRSNTPKPSYGRFADYAVRVELLNRFRSAQEVKTTIQGLASGAVDIVIGTHRLLQRDVVFKNLGLIIIDEEHRFGVRAQGENQKAAPLGGCFDIIGYPHSPHP